MKPLIPFVVMLLLGGCSVGPDYQRPAMAMPVHYKEARGWQQATPLDAQSKGEWWAVYHDATLSGLLNQVSISNQNVANYAAQYRQAQALASESRAALFPSLGYDGSVTRSGSHATDSSVRTTSSSHQAELSASWELDLWGKVRRQVEAANAQQQAAIEQRNDALVSLEAEVARAWLQLRGAQSTIQTLQQQIEVAQQTTELTQSQQRNGLAPLTDVENARAQLSTLQAQLPQYQSQARQAMNGLAVLLGKTPGALDAELSTPKALPPLPQFVPVGIPSTLARRRPDIRQAEATLHAQTAEIGVSVAQLFPSLSLTGQLGVRNTDVSYLDNWSSHFYSYGPSLSIPIFQGGQLVSSVKLARAQQASAALDYRQTVLTALQDVENALVSYRADQQRVTALDETTGALQRAFDLASDSYRQGLSTFLEVLDAQRQLAQAEEQATQARMQSALDLVALYKALGGGWETYQNVDMPQYPVFGPATQAN